MNSPIPEVASTPMLKQYHALKANHQDCILLFRLGDFYEMFFDDAKIASRELDLVLTSRGKGSASEVPMCGMPHHAADNYIGRLIKAGHKVAICDQIEDPATAKGIVKRDVTRVITSGTYLDEESAKTKFLLALCPNGKSVGVSFTDLTVGSILTNQYPAQTNRLVELIANLPVQECIFPESYAEKVKLLFTHPLLKFKHVSLSPFADWSFSPEMAKKSLCDHFSVHNLSGFGLDNLEYATASCGGLLEYLKSVNKQPLKHIDKISIYTDDDYVFISTAAHRGLELETFIKTLDRTETAMGKRKFENWITHPLKNPVAIRERQHAVKILKDNSATQKSLRDLLRQIPDVERNISRLSCGYTHAKDLLAIRNLLALTPELREKVSSLQKENSIFTVKDIPELREKILVMINEEIPLSKPEGKVIKSGYNAELDHLRGLLENGHQFLREYQAKEIKRSGINSLKVGFNKVFGYYIEISNANKEKTPSDYIRKQTLVNGERFITPELKEYEEKILTAEEKILAIENKLIREAHQLILNHSINLHQLCEEIATIDVIYSFTSLAQLDGYIAPEISLDAHIDIEDGRHPVVEKILGDRFIANDIKLDHTDNHLIILTGPNMAGKSTYIRQTALLTILAQTGSYIPAKRAHVGIVDKVFTRIGAHDDIARGQSTFMVEMNETADILNNLSERSLVILDEIGRGTSTYDGLSLAWALAEHLAKTNVRTLFATHFHELTALADQFSGVKNYNVSVKEWKDQIIFLHKIVPGSTDDSYGIYVAKLAGIPEKIIQRSKEILTKLELKNDLKEHLAGKSSNETQLSLFDRQPVDPIAAELKIAIEEIDIDNLRPIDALNKLQELKNKLNA